MSKPYEADLYSNLSVLVGEDWRYRSAMEPALALINDPLPHPLLSSLVSLSPTPLPDNNANTHAYNATNNSRSISSSNHNSSGRGSNNNGASTKNQKEQYRNLYEQQQLQPL